MTHNIIITIGMLGVILSMASQLEVIAQDTSDQTIELATQMNQAMPCALEGRLLSECVNLTDTSSEDLAAYREFLDESQMRMNATFP